MINIFYQTLLIYFFLSVYTAIFSWLSSIAKTYTYRYLFGFLAIIIPSFVGGVRYNVGTDFDNYVTIFSGIELRDNLEFGFENLVDFISLFTNNYSIYFFVLQFLTMIFILLGLFKYKGHLNVGIGMLTFMLLYYLTSLNISRQMVGGAIVFYSLNYIFEKKPMKYVVLILLASSFHLTSLIMLPIYFIWHTNILKSKKTLYLVSLIILLVVFNLDEISLLIVRNFPGLSYYGSYFRKKPVTTINILNLIKDGVFIVSGYLVYKDEKLSNKYFSLFYIMFIVGTILELSGGLYINSAVTRIAIPLKMVLLYIVPYVTEQMLTKRNYLYSVANIVYIFTVFYYDFFVMGYGEVVPYQSIFTLK